MITTEEFERWWNQEGSAINPTAFEDTSEHVKRVSEIAWANGHYMATVTNLKSQQWKPIEKPEDVSDIHRPVVLWYPSHDAILCGAWDHSIEEWREWITDCPIVDNKPTHWMPLPAPPMSDK